MKACIAGAGVVGGFGCGLAALEAALCRPLAPGPIAAAAAPGSGAPDAPALMARTDLLDQFIPPRTLRRVDHYARMALLASHLAITDADMTGGLPEEAGLIVATGMGPTANTLDLQPADVALADLALSPILFSNSVQNAAAAYISMLLNLRGPCLSINQYEMSVPLAFQTAIDWLEEGRTSTVLVGGVDGFSKALHEASLSRRGPADGDRGRRMPVGEGSAFFILARPETADALQPYVHDVRVGGANHPGSVPTAGTLILHNGSGAPPGCAGPLAAHAGFAHVYGAFPTSMGMDVAAALILLRTRPVPDLLLPLCDGQRTLHENLRIACCKKGATGDWGSIVIGRGSS
jgi:3-oxoacyl-[acyl-carrier-protein] synthase II